MPAFGFLRSWGKWPILLAGILALFPTRSQGAPQTEPKTPSLVR
jgi:hypothetical protein